MKTQSTLENASSNDALSAISASNSLRFASALGNAFRKVALPGALTSLKVPLTLYPLARASFRTFEPKSPLAPTTHTVLFERFMFRSSRGLGHVYKNYFNDIMQPQDLYSNLYSSEISYQPEFEQTTPF